MKSKIIITIPAYNEEKSVSWVIKEIKGVMNKTNYDYNILVVNDGSKDKTEELARKAGAVVISHYSNKGLAETFRTEMKECIKLGADIIVHTDADGQYLAEDIPKLIKKIEEGYDLVLGSRFIGRIKHMPLLKRLGNKAFAMVFRHLTKTRLTDTTTGFRAFNRNVAEEIEYINQFTYTQEQIIKASKQGFRITEIPISTRETRPSRLFSNPFEYAVKAWINIFRIYRDYNPLKFFGITGGVFILTGFIIALYFLYLHFFGGGIVGHSGLLFLMLLLIIGGLQIIFFGFLADMRRG